MWSLKKQEGRLGYLFDVEYAGKRGVCLLKFFDPIKQEIFTWYDKTGHLPYLITNAPLSKIEELLGKDKEYKGYLKITRYDAIKDENVELYKVFSETPLAIGGDRDDNSRQGNYRDILLDAGFEVWEGWVRYTNSYCYDLDIIVGMPYIVTENSLVHYVEKEAEQKIEDTIKEFAIKGVKDTPILRHWIKIFEYKMPKPRMLAIDIEVLPETPNTMPNAIIAKQPIIAVSLVDTDGLKKVLLLKRNEVPIGEGIVDGSVQFFDREEDLVVETIKYLRSYPTVITFNGDSFDLMYLYNRGKRLNISDAFNPIYVIKKTCYITNAIHIDLYPFFKNRSIQNYAFSGKYKDYGLDDISHGLLNKGKIEFDEDIMDLPHLDLARYCLNDSVLTLELMMFDDMATTNLILTLLRMSNLSPYQLTRRGIGDWVKSTFYYLLRVNNVLIPNPTQLKEKGEIQTKATIKGKKYQGAIVWEPKPGVFFNVVVMDFASLYPTEVKERNIGYGTINCKHPECQSNLVPDTTHHICTKNRALEADVIGGLRDVRVYRYKNLGKTNSYYFILQQAIKVYINASYGVFGNEAFGLYCAPVAEAITAYSRRDIMAVVGKCGEVGIEVLGGDTDSVFLNNPTLEETENLQKWVRDTLNLDLGVDKVYRYAIFSTRKKNYLGIFKDGKADIKGLTGKKSNTPEIIKRTFNDVINLLGKVYTKEDYESTSRTIERIILDLQKRINNKEWEDIEELAVRMRLSKDPDQYSVNSQHVKAAKMLIEHGYPVKGGDIVSFVKAKNEEGVIPTKFADPNLVDIETYLEHVQSAFEQIVEPMDINISVVRESEGRLVRPTELFYYMLPKTLNSKEESL